MKMSSVGHVGTGTKVSGVSQIAWLNKDSDRSPQLTDGKKIVQAMTVRSSRIVLR